jgi:hypothetical protein
MTHEKIILELTRDQAYIVKESPELYARIRIGHFTHLWSVLISDYEKNGGLESIPDHRTWDAICTLLQRMWFPNLPYGSINWGVGHDDRADRAFTINEVIRHFLHPDAYDQPMNWSHDPMPKIRSE